MPVEEEIDFQENNQLCKFLITKNMFNSGNTYYWQASRFDPLWFLKQAEKRNIYHDSADSANKICNRKNSK